MQIAANGKEKLSRLSGSERGRERERAGGREKQSEEDKAAVKKLQSNNKGVGTVVIVTLGLPN